MGNGSAEEPVGRQQPPGPPPDPAALLEQRQAARERRDFAAADAIRLAPPLVVSTGELDLFLDALPGLLDVATAPATPEDAP